MAELIVMLCVYCTPANTSAPSARAPKAAARSTCCTISRGVAHGDAGLVACGGEGRQPNHLRLQRIHPHPRPGPREVAQGCTVVAHFSTGKCVRQA